MDPTITDPETSEDPAEEPGEITMDGADLNEDAEVSYSTVSITDYRKILDSVTISNITGGKSGELDISNLGEITVETGETLSVDIEAKPNWKIKSVKSGDKDVSNPSGNTYSLGEVKENAEIAIEVVETYNFDLDNSATGETKITLTRLVSKDGKEEKEPFGTNPAVEKDGEDLRFITTYDDSSKETTLSVSYTVDGEDGENSAVTLTGVKEDDPDSTATPKATRTVYTIPKDVIDDLGSLKITLVVNNGVKVTFKKDGKVTVQEEKEVADEKDPTKTKTEWTNVTDEGITVIAGNKVKFKAVGNDAYKITAVNTVKKETVEGVETDVETKVCDANTTGIYELTVKEATQFSFTTELDSTKSKALPFTLVGEEGSATATITEVYVKGETNKEETKLTADTTPALADFWAAIGQADGVLKANAEKPVSIPSTVAKESVTKIKVTVAPAEGGNYTLAKIDDTPVAETDNAKAKEITFNYADIKGVKVETAAVVSGAASYFKITDPADAEMKKRISVKVDGTKVKAAGTDNPGVYEVAKGEGVASFQIEVAEGWELTDDFVKALKDKTGVVTGVTEEIKDKKTVYTVKLLAKGLDTDKAAVTKADLGTPADKLYVFTAAVDKEASSEDGYDLGEFTFTDDEKYPLPDGATSTNKKIAYNAGMKVSVTPKTGYHLANVFYTMGDGAEQPVTVVRDDDNKTEEAEIEIKNVTGHVKIKIETVPAYNLTLAPLDGNTPKPEQVNIGYGDETYEVRFNGKYTVSLSPDNVELKDLQAEIKDGGTIIGRGKKINNTLQLWMNRAWADKELTVSVKVKDTVVGELYLHVNKRRNDLSLNGGAPITQIVSSTKAYPITTDGEALANIASSDNTHIKVAGKDKTGGKDNTFAALLNGKVAVKDGKLSVTIPAAKYEEVMKKTKDAVTGADPSPEEWAPQVAVITVTDPDDETVKASVEVSATPVFNPKDAPSVSEVPNGVSDTTIDVDVKMDAETPGEDGKVYYVVTAEWTKETVDAGQTAPERDPKLKQSVTKVVERTGSSTKARLTVGESKNLGEGAVGTYTVTARAVYAMTGVEPDETAVTSATVASDDNTEVSEISKEGSAASITTISPRFEAGLKLKKDSKKKPASTIYTGQKNVYIATPEWSKKDVDYKVVADAEDITDHVAGIEVGFDENGDLVALTTSGATPGKHTIQVTAFADETGKNNGDYSGKKHTMYASRATITVNVANGIEWLGVETPGNKVYKENGKPAAYKVKPVYAKELKNNKWVEKPKTKKVTWDVVGVASAGENANKDGSYYGDINKFSLTSAPEGVTMKNGTVNIAKTFTVNSRRPQNNQFRILVKAADYAGNTTAALSSPITITNEAVNVSNLVIARADQNAKGVNGYTVIAIQDGKKAVPVKAADLQPKGSKYPCIYALTKPAEKKFYTNNEWKALGVAESYNLTYKSSSEKVLRVSTSGALYDVTAGKKVNIKVTTTDGNKKNNNNTFALDLGYTEFNSNKAVLNIDAYPANSDTLIKEVYAAKKETDIPENKAKVEKTFSVPGVAKLVVDLKIASYDDKGKFKEFLDGSYANYKLTVKGGKISETRNDGVIVNTTSKDTTLNLTVGSGKDAQKYTYVLTNEAYNASTGAPKVTVGGSLYQYYEAVEQPLKMTVLNGKDKFTGKLAKVEVDWTAKSDRNKGDLARLDNALKNKIVKIDDKTGIIDLAFTQSTLNSEQGDGRGYVNAGSYKLKVTVGTGTDLKGFKAETQPAAVTLKVAKNKAFTFKPVTSYTINKIDGAAVLTGKTNLNAKLGETAKLTFTNLQNANIKGKSNQFTHYFKLERDASGTNYLKLNTEDEAVQKLMYNTKTVDGKEVIDKDSPKNLDLSEIKKEDLTGYVTYTANANVHCYNPGAVKTETVKITVKVAADPKKGVEKPAQKYIPEDGTEIKPAANSTTNVNVLVNGSFVKVAYAIADPAKEKQNEKSGLVVDSVKDGQVVLKSTASLSADQKGGYTINMLVVPETSYYAAEIAGKTNKEEREALIALYGIPVKVTVVAKDNAVNKTVPTEETKKPSDENKATIAITNAKEDFTVIIPKTGEANATVTYTATVTGGADSLDKNVVWSIDGTKPDKVSISESGVLTVEAGAAKGTVTIVAALKADPSVKAQETVTLSEESGGNTPPTLDTIKVEVSSGDAKVKIGDENGLLLTVTLTNDDNSPSSDFSGLEWTVENSSDSSKKLTVGTDVTFTAKDTSKPNEFTMVVKNGTAEAGTYNVVAKKGSITSVPLLVTVDLADQNAGG